MQKTSSPEKGYLFRSTHLATGQKFLLGTATTTDSEAVVDTEGNMRDAGDNFINHGNSVYVLMRRVHVCKKQPEPPIQGSCSRYRSIFPTGVHRPSGAHMTSRGRKVKVRNNSWKHIALLWFPDQERMDQKLTMPRLNQINQYR